MKLDNMIWQVGYAVNADPAHGIDEHQRIIAIFETFINAEQFIRNCIPQENQSRFFILNSYNNEQIFL